MVLSNATKHVVFDIDIRVVSVLLFALETALRMASQVPLTTVCMPSASCFDT